MVAKSKSKSDSKKSSAKKVAKVTKNEATPVEKTSNGDTQEIERPPVQQQLLERGVAITVLILISNYVSTHFGPQYKMPFILVGLFVVSNILSIFKRHY